MRKLTAFGYGAALAIMILGGGPACAAGSVERITASGNAPSYDLATAAGPDRAARKPTGTGVEWSPRVAYWRRHVAPTSFVRAVNRRAIGYGVSVGRHRVDVRLTKPF
jgi:hypothetical protein